MRQQKKYTIQFYSDPGHGWAKVKITWLFDLGIAKDISSYSYVKGEWAYLEEDGDLSTFMDALRKHCGHKNIEFKDHTNAYKQSRIRNYQSYSPAYAEFIKNNS